jgi:cephalosporin hydroxylase
MIFGITLAVLLACAVLVYFFRRPLLSLVERPVSMLFHYFCYRSGTVWATTKWMGRPLLKWPCDLWMYQETICETKPDLIIETGTNQGGSALYYAHLFDLLGSGRVISVDIANSREGLPKHPRIEFLRGSSTSPEILTAIKNRVRPDDKVMVILDSDHTKEHVAEELKLYSALVSRNCYLVVEDTNVNGHPVWSSHGPGPMEAVLDFLQSNPGFVADKSREKFKVTFYPNGWLRLVAPTQSI